MFYCRACHPEWCEKHKKSFGESFSGYRSHIVFVVDNKIKWQPGRYERLTVLCLMAQSVGVKAWDCFASSSPSFLMLPRRNSRARSSLHPSKATSRKLHFKSCVLWSAMAERINCQAINLICILPKRTKGAKPFNAELHCCAGWKCFAN